MEKIKVLFLSANPRDTQFLQLAEEFEKIEYYILKSPRSDLLDLIVEKEVQATALTRLLQKHKPHIVHFSGHGDGDGIFLLDAEGNSRLVGTQDLRQLFGLLKENIRLVVLNACYTDDQAKEIAEIVGCAVGMSKAIYDEDALLFAASLYENIAFECSIGKAFELGELQLKLAGRTEASAIPVLRIGSGVNPNEINLTKYLYKGSRLLSRPELWNNYVIILSFSKLVHHIFQTLDIQRLRDFVKDFNSIYNPDKDRNFFQAVTGFAQNWQLYVSVFKDFSNELDQMSPNVVNAFNELTAVSEPKIAEIFVDAKTYYTNIDNALRMYSEAHKKVNDSMIAEQKNIVSFLGNLDNAGLIGSHLLCLSQCANSLIGDADNLLREMIGAIAQGGE